MPEERRSGEGPSNSGEASTIERLRSALAGAMEHCDERVARELDRLRREKDRIIACLERQLRDCVARETRRRDMRDTGVQTDAVIRATARDVFGDSGRLESPRMQKPARIFRFSWRKAVFLVVLIVQWYIYWEIQPGPFGYGGIGTRDGFLTRIVWQSPWIYGPDSLFAQAGRSFYSWLPGLEEDVWGFQTFQDWTSRRE